MKAANQEAMRVNHHYIGSDDILVGIAVGEGDLASQAIAAHVSVGAIRQKLAEMLRSESPTTSRGKKIVEYAMEDARRLFHLHVGTEHLLLGLLRDASSDASRALSELGVDLDHFRSEFLTKIPPGSPDEFRKHHEMQIRFADHEDVKALKREIERLQLEAERAVLAKDFNLVATLFEERRSVERTLWELYRKLSEG